jgi:hypothetical protein
MKYQLRLGVAAFALLAGAGVAMAADAGSTSKDHLNLTSAQQKDIWQSVSKQNVKETAAVPFKAMIGEVVPTSIKLHALPSDATREAPAVKSYEFAMLQDQVLLVDPKSKKITDIIRQ